MAEPIQILTVKKDHGDGMIVDFTDGTTAGYVAEELLKLRPRREPTEGLTGRLRRPTSELGTRIFGAVR